MALRLRTDDLVWESLDDEIIALNLRTSRYLRINASGAGLWAMLVDGTDDEDLISSLSATFEVDRARAEADVNAFVGTLEDRGLIERRA